MVIQSEGLFNLCDQNMRQSINIQSFDQMSLDEVVLKACEIIQ